MVTPSGGGSLDVSQPADVSRATAIRAAAGHLLTALEQPFLRDPFDHSPNEDRARRDPIASGDEEGG